jgi:hypothetical protein
MKSARVKKFPRSRCTSDSANLFFRAMVKAAKINEKTFYYDLRVSKSLVDAWINGSRNDPFTQARKTVRVFLDKKCFDLLPAILMFIAGEENFDGAVMERVKQALAPEKTPQQLTKIRGEGGEVA